MPLRPPRLFIGYSDSDALSKVLCEVATDIALRLGFPERDIHTYRNPRSGEASWYYELPAPDVCVMQARQADLTIAIVVRNWVGSPVKVGQLEGADGSKTINRLEIEAALSAQRPVIALFESKDFVTRLHADAAEDVRWGSLGKTRARLALVESQNKLLQYRRQTEQHERFTAFDEWGRDAAVAHRGRLQRNPFDSVADFEMKVEAGLKAWLGYRSALIRRPSEWGSDDLRPKNVPSRDALVKRIAERIQPQRTVLVFGHRAQGAGTVAFEAALEAARVGMYKNVLYADCRGVEAEGYCRDLQAFVGAPVGPGRNAVDEARHGVFHAQSLIVLHDPTYSRELEGLIRSGAACVIVTPHRSLGRDLAEVAEADRFDVRPPNADEAQQLVRAHIPPRFLYDAALQAELVSTLGGLPGALEQAGRYLAPGAAGLDRGAALMRQIQEDGPESPLREFFDGLRHVWVERLAALSVLPGRGFGVGAARWTLGTDEAGAAHLLAELVDACVVEQVSTDRYRVRPDVLPVLGLRALERVVLAARERLVKGMGALLGEADLGDKEALGRRINVVMPDHGLALDVLVPEASKAGVDHRFVMAVDQIARRAGDWHSRERLWRARLDAAVDERDRAHCLYYLGGTLKKRGNYREARVKLEECLKLTARDAAGFRAKVLSTLGPCLLRMGRVDEAEARVGEALDLERAFARPRHGVWLTMHVLANIKYRKHNGVARKGDQHVWLLEESIRLGEAAKDWQHLGHAYYTSSTWLARQDPERALDHARRSAEAAGRARDEHQYVTARVREAELLRALGRGEEARGVLDDTVKATDRVADGPAPMALYRAMLDDRSDAQGRRGSVQAIYRYASTDPERRIGLVFDIVSRLRDEGRAEEAAETLRMLEGLDLSTLPARTAATLLNLRGQDHLDAGRPALALEALLEAGALAERSGDSRGAVVSALNIAKAYEAIGRREEATGVLRARLEAPGSDLRAKVQIANLLGTLYTRSRDVGRAEKVLWEAEAWERELQEQVDGPSIAVTYHNLGQLLLKRRKAADAVRVLSRSLAIEVQYKRERGQMMVHHTLARALLACDDVDRAWRHLRRSAELERLYPRVFHRVQLLHTEAWLERAEGREEQALKLLNDSLVLGDASTDFRLINHRVFVNLEIAGILERSDPPRALEHLRSAGELAGTARWIESSLLVARRLAMMLGGTADGAKEAEETLAGAVDRALCALDHLAWGRKLLWVVNDLVRLRLRAGNEAGAREVLASVAQVIEARADLWSRDARLAPLWCSVVVRLGQLLSATGGSSADSRVGAHFELNVQKALRGGDYRSGAELLDVWATTILVRTGSAEAAALLERYLLMHKDVAGPQFCFAVSLRRAEILARHARRRGAADAPNPDLVATIKCADQARGYAEAAGLAGGAEDAALLAATALLDAGLVDEARPRMEAPLRGVAFETIGEWEPGDGSPEAAAATRRAGRVLAAWARVDLRDSVTRLSVILGRLRERGSWEQFLEFSLLKARMLRGILPYTAEECLKSALGGLKSSPALRARALTALARHHERWGAHEQASRCFREAGEELEKLGDEEKTCDAWRRASIHARQAMEDQTLALELAQRAMKAVRAVHGWRRIRVHHSLAKLHRELGDLARAREFASQAIAQARALGDQRLEGDGYLTRGAILRADNNVEAALGEWEAARALIAPQRATRTHLMVLQTIARMSYRCRRIPEAIRACDDVLMLAESHGISDDEMVESRLVLAKSLRHLGMLPDAEAVVDEALKRLAGSARTGTRDLDRARSSQVARQRLRLELGQIMFAMNRPGDAEARREFETVEQERAQAKGELMLEQDEGTTGILMTLMGRLHARRSDAERSNECLAGASEIRLVPGASEQVRAIMELDHAVAKYWLRQYDEAMEHGRRALEICGSIPDPAFRATTTAYARLRLSEVALLQGDVVGAGKHAEEAKSAARGNRLLMVAATECLVRARLRAGLMAEAFGLSLDGLQIHEEMMRAANRPGAATRNSVILTWLAAKACANEASGAEYERRYQKELRALEERKVTILLTEVGEAAQPDAPALSRELSAAAAPRPAPGSRVRGSIEWVRAGGTPRGMKVALGGGHSGWCPWEAVFTEGQDGDLSARYLWGDTYDFEVGSGPPEELVPLVPAVLPSAAWAELDGRVAPARIVSRRYEADEYPGKDAPVTVVLDTGERIDMDLRAHGAWAEDLADAGVHEAAPWTFVKVTHHPGEVPPLRASLKEACLGVLNELAAARTPLVGKVLEVKRYWVVVRLAPCVVVRVLEPEWTDKTVLRRALVKLGDTVIVQLARCDMDKISVTSCRLFDTGSGGGGEPGAGVLELTSVFGERFDAPEVGRRGPGQLGGTAPTKYRGRTLLAYQREAIEAVERGDHLLLTAPTGSGKTLVADWAIENALTAHNRRVVFASPVKALSNQKFRDFRTALGADKVGLITGDVEINPLAPVLVVTTEVFRNRAVECPESLKYFNRIIFDEIHYLDDKSRGSAWEESIIFAPPNIQMLALSATVSNPAALCRWLRTARERTDRPVRSAVIVPETPIPRPVPLVHHFCTGKPEWGLTVADSTPQLPPETFRPPEPGLDAPPEPGVRRKRPRDNIKRRKMITMLLLEELAPYHTPALCFCLNRQFCEEYAVRAAGTEFVTAGLEVPEDARERFDAIARGYGVEGGGAAARRLRRMIGRGVAYHHSGLPPGLRMTVEELFEKKVIRVLFATMTFAVGVNMPARSVVINSLRYGHPGGTNDRLLTRREFSQMAGRAGRLGGELGAKDRDPQGDVYAVVVPGELFESELQEYEAGAKSIEPIESHFDPDYRTLLNVRCKRGMEFDDFWRRSFAAATSHAEAWPRARQLMESRWRVLEALKYVDGAGKLTPKGEMCTQIASCGVQVAEAFFECQLALRSPIMIAAFVVSLIAEEGYKVLDANGNPVDIPGVVDADLTREFAFRNNRVRKLERENGISGDLKNVARRRTRKAEQLVRKWAEGATLSETLALTRRHPDDARPGIEEGVFAMWVRQTIQILASLARVVRSTDPANVIIPKLTEAISLLDRDEIRLEVPAE